MSLQYKPTYFRLPIETQEGSKTSLDVPRMPPPGVPIIYAEDSGGYEPVYQEIDETVNRKTKEIYDYAVTKHATHVEMKDNRYTKASREPPKPAMSLQSLPLPAIPKTVDGPLEMRSALRPRDNDYQGERPPVELPNDTDLKNVCKAEYTLPPPRVVEVETVSKYEGLNTVSTGSVGAECEDEDVTVLPSSVETEPICKDIYLTVPAGTIDTGNQNQN